MSKSSKASGGDIPFSLLGKIPHLEMQGNKSFSLDGKFSVLEYSEDAIKLKTTAGVYDIFGTGLLITAVTDANINIIGKINSIEFN